MYFNRGMSRRVSTTSLVRMVRQAYKIDKIKTTQFEGSDINGRTIFKAAAIDIKIDVIPEINNPYKCIDFLAPDKELSTTFKYSFNDEIDENNQEKYKFYISYKDIYDKPTYYSHEYEIDVTPFIVSSKLNVDDIKNITGEVNKMILKYDSMKDKINDQLMYSVILKSIRNNNIKLNRLIMDLTGCHLKEFNNLIDNLPSVIL